MWKLKLVCSVRLHEKYKDGQDHLAHFRMRERADAAAISAGYGPEFVQHREVEANHYILELSEEYPLVFYTLNGNTVNFTVFSYVQVVDNG